MQPILDAIDSIAAHREVSSGENLFDCLLILNSLREKSLIKSRDSSRTELRFKLEAPFVW